MNRIKKMSIALVAVIVMLLAFSVVSFAEPAADGTETAAVTTEVAEASGALSVQEASLKSSKAIAAGAAVAVAAAAGALAMGMVVSKAADGTARQPEAAGKIQTMMMMGLVFIETAIIYALIVAILIIFVL